MSAGCSNSRPLASRYVTPVARFRSESRFTRITFESGRISQFSCLRSAGITVVLGLAFAPCEQAWLVQKPPRMHWPSISLRVHVGLRLGRDRIHVWLVAELLAGRGEHRAGVSHRGRRIRIFARARPSNGLPPSWITPFRLPALPPTP